jgi:adenosylmethionine-8-amino-7-oxononanoate aminotransferase
MKSRSAAAAPAPSSRASRPASGRTFLCLSKGISGGYLPLSLVMTRDEIYQAFYDADVTRGFLHSHSYTGNPLACRARWRRWRSSPKTTCWPPIACGERADARWRRWPSIRRCATSAARHDLGVRRGDRRCAGAATSRAASSPRRLEHELLMRPIGRSVYLMPPYILSDDEIDLLADAHAVFEQVQDE